MWVEGNASTQRACYFSASRVFMVHSPLPGTARARTTVPAVCTTTSRDPTVRAFIVACLIAVVLAVAGYYVLSSIQQPVSQAFSSNAVRLD